jgi:hypothetical protein
VSSKVNSSKGADGHTLMAQTSGSKSIKVDFAPGDVPADIGPAPTTRVYTRDYAKDPPSPDDKDFITGTLGNPLRW